MSDEALPSAKRVKVTELTFESPEDVFVRLDDSTVKTVATAVSEREAVTITTSDSEHEVRVIKDPFMCCVFKKLFNNEFLGKAKVRE